MSSDRITEGVDRNMESTPSFGRIAGWLRTSLVRCPNDQSDEAKYWLVHHFCTYTSWSRTISRLRMEAAEKRYECGTMTRGDEAPSNCGTRSGRLAPTWKASRD